MALEVCEPVQETRESATGDGCGLLLTASSSDGRCSTSRAMVILAYQMHSIQCQACQSKDGCQVSFLPEYLCRKSRFKHQPVQMI